MSGGFTQSSMPFVKIIVVSLHPNPYTLLHMAEIKEIRKETIVYKDGAGSALPVHETHVVHEDHVVHDHDRSARREVRRQISGFRSGVYLILDIIEIVLIAEFFVKLFGLNPFNPIVRFIDILSYPLYAPFAGLMTAITPYFIINWSILIAMIVYALLAYFIVALFASGGRASYRR